MLSCSYIVIAFPIILFTWGIAFISPLPLLVPHSDTRFSILVEEVAKNKIGIQASDVNCPPVKPSYTTGVKVTM